MRHLLPAAALLLAIAAILAACGGDPAGPSAGDDAPPAAALRLGFDDVVVDAEGEFAETDETNNTHTRTFTAVP